MWIRTFWQSDFLPTETIISLQTLSKLLVPELEKAAIKHKESQAIVQQLLKSYFQVNLTDFILNPLLRIDDTMQKKLFNALTKLKRHEPLQYVTQSAFFTTHYFKVTPEVLIPRPETEEWVTHLMRIIPPPSSILDIGTGSGCIAITLKKKFPQASVDALDISTNALNIAMYNAKKTASNNKFYKNGYSCRRTSFT